MRTRTRTAAFTLAATLAVLPLVAGPVQAGHTERAALTGSIVYIKDHNVWLMSPDGATKRQLTTDGSAASAYINPSQSDDGTIFVIKDGQLRRVDRGDGALGPPVDLFQYDMGLDHVDVSADGSRVTYTTYGTVTFEDPDPGQPDEVAGASEVFVAHVTDGSLVGGGDEELHEYSSWADASTLLTVSAFDIHVRPVPGEPQPWVSCRLLAAGGTCPPAASSGDDWSGFVDYPSLSPTGAVLAYSYRSTVGEFDEVPEGMALATTNGPPPAEPAHACLAPGLHDRPNGYSWSPDGSTIAFDDLRVNADRTAYEELSPGISVFTVDLDAPDCGASMAEVVEPGGGQQDWGPAALSGGLPGPGPGPGPTPTPTPGPGPSGAVGFDGDPATTERVDSGTASGAALAVSGVRFGDGEASHVVLSRDDEFPDSLAGAALTRGGPLLFTSSAALDPATRAEVGRVLPVGGTVYLLGGEVALSSAVEGSLADDGYAVRRLAEASRVETAVAVADEVLARNPGIDVAAVARAFGPPDNPTAGWVDSVTGGAWAASAGAPVLVTDGGGVHSAVGAWLAAHPPAQTVLLGGTAALGQAVEDAVPAPSRVAGGDRAETAAAVATELWRIGQVEDRRFLVLNAYREDGWAFGLAAAGLADDADAPMLVVGDDVPPATGDLVTGCAEVDLLLIGDDSVISTPAAAQLDTLDTIC